MPKTRLSHHQCPMCPANTAYWEPIELNGFTLGNVYICVICEYPDIIWLND